MMLLISLQHPKKHQHYYAACSFLSEKIKLGV